MEKDIKTDIENAKHIIEEDLKENNQNSYNFSKYCKVYDFTTENNSYYNYMTKNMQTLLTINGSGDTIINSLLHGVKSVTTFDINQLTYYNTMLKIYLIKALDLTTFLNYYFGQGKNNLLNKNIFDEIKNTLPEDIKEFWSSLYKDFEGNEIASGLYRNAKTITNKPIRSVNDATTLNEYLTSKNYQYVKKRIKNLKIEFIQGNIETLPFTLKRKYDAINLSNVQELYYSDTNKYKKLIEEGYIPMLKENSSIMLAYIYKNSIEQLNYLSKNIDKFNLDKIDLLKEIEKQENKELARQCLDKNNIKKYIFIKLLEDIGLEKILLPNAGYGNGHGNKDMALIYTKRTK